MSNEERLDRLELKIDRLGAKSDRRFDELIEAVTDSQAQANRRFDAIDRWLFALGRRFAGLDLRADVIEENLSQIMHRLRIRQKGPE